MTTFIQRDQEALFSWQEEVKGSGISDTKDPQVIWQAACNYKLKLFEDECNKQIQALESYEIYNLANAVRVIRDTVTNGSAF